MIRRVVASVVVVVVVFALATAAAGQSNPQDVLMVVVDPSSLTSQESAKKTLIESWGYRVTLVDQDSNQSTFDTAIARTDVAYITEDVSSSAVGTKLSSAEIGVVSEEAELYDELGIGDAVGWSSGTSIDVQDNTHYITNGFAIGSVTIMTSSDSIPRINTNKAPDLRELAIETAKVTMGTLERGDALYGGGTAAGRRVSLPWGGGSFDIANLTADGETILQRAIEWAATDYTVLMPVTSTSTPSAQEQLRLDWLDSIGYSCELIAQTATVAQFQAAAQQVDVIWITEEVNSSNFSSSMALTSCGIVNGERALADRWGFYSDDSVTASETTLTVPTTDHFIVEPFSGTNVTLFTSPQPTTQVAGTVAPDLNVIGDWGTNDALCTIEAGGRLHDSSVANGRRVQLSWGTGSFDFASLTADGKTILQRALWWGGALRGHWAMDDGSGTVATDQRGKSDGTLINGPSWITGRIGGGIDFDGTSDYINVPRTDFQNFSGDFTITGWFRLNNPFDSTNASTEIIAEKYLTQDFNMFLGLVGADYTRSEPARGSMVAKIENGPGGNDYVYTWSSMTSWEANRWYHFVFVVDSSAATSIKFYIDGADVSLTSQKIGSGWTNLHIKYDSDLNIGGRDANQLSGPYYFDGQVDDFRLYRQAMGQDEILLVKGLANPRIIKWVEVEGY